MAENDEAKKEKMVVRRAANYRVSTVTGAFGGITNGLLKFDLHTDWVEQPDEIPVTRTESGLRQDEVPVRWVRHIECGHVLTADHALALSTWLLSKVVNLPLADVQAKVAEVFELSEVSEDAE